MNRVDPVTNHWALLIGINFYVNNLNPLKGCVRDVESIKQYLEAGSTPVNVDIFRASTPSDPNSNRPIEEPDSWPTFENVTSRLKKITAGAKPGDFVYIHYSGHGTQMEASSEYSNSNTGDLALVLYDDVHGSRYLRGLELAYLLNEMVKKRLFVTLVLDCCFSGSVVRLGDPHGDAIRAVDYDYAIDAAYPQYLGRSPSHQVGFSTLRDVRILPTWLVDPSGYTILTACGPHEIARELTFEGGRNGALSYFLLRALTSLKKSGVEITHQSLYQHLCVRFHASWPQQSPMRYGNKNFSFFGKLMSRPDIAFISVFRTRNDNCLCLEAGYAHGVYKDDEYALYPLDSPEDVFNNAKQASVEVRVDAVRGLTSDLVGINSMSAISQVKTGWKAKPLTHLPPRKVLVRHMDYGDNQSQWVADAKQRRFLSLFSTEDVDSQPCLFNVTRNKLNEYEILDGSYQKITSLPTIPLDRKGALDSVLDLLDHLAAFKYIEGIENRIPTTSFEDSFKIHLSDGTGSDLEAAGLLDVKHNDKLIFTVQNTSDEPLYLHIYNLGPSWQINGLISNDGGGDYKVVLPKNDMNGHTGEKKITLQMTVPELFRDRGEHVCEDIVKFFITSRPSSFAALELPKILIAGKDSDASLRGNHNRLSKFLSELATPFRGAEDGVLDEEWVTRNFVIRTHYDKDNI